MRLTAREVQRATITPAGPGTLRVRATGAGFEATAWGDGADWLLEHAPQFIGAHDTAEGFDPTPHPFVAEAHHHLPGLRIGRTGAVLEAAIPSICEQKVTGFEAHRSWRQVVRALGAPAPGPLDLWVPPDSDTLAGVAYYDLHVMGLERKRADTVRRVAAQANRLEPLADQPPALLTARLTSIAGVGPWTAAEVAMVALGDPDAVSVGDYHLPNIVCGALAGAEQGTDEMMLELLEPFTGHRGRVIRLVMNFAPKRERRGPRRSPHSIAQI